MADLKPVKSEFDTVTGVSTTARPIRRTLSDLNGYFNDGAAYQAAISAGDSTRYEYFDMGVPQSPGNVAYGTTSVRPGRIGDEYFMTKGHFHAVIDTAEVYYCLSGKGGMMMESPEGDVVWQKMAPGDVVYVPGRWAHRSFNTSEEDPFVVFFAFPGRAGHDYGSIRRRGFRKLVVERDGRPSLIDNPRWIA